VLTSKASVRLDGVRPSLHLPDEHKKELADHGEPKEQDKGEEIKGEAEAEDQGGKMDFKAEGVDQTEGGVPDKTQEPKRELGTRRRKPNPRYVGDQWA
jgi:hypothetical protein